MKIKKGDNILVTAGKDRGRTAKVLRSFPKENHVLAEGLNLHTKRMRPRKQGETGQMVKIPTPMHVSNVKFLCPKCGKAVRLGYRVDGNKKYRVCSKCKAEV